jgi:hypothetical protein
MVTSGLLCSAKAVLQERDGFEIVNGIPCPRWKDVRPLRVIEKDGWGTVVLSESEGENNE